jgi:prophage regulatory protein
MPDIPNLANKGGRPRKIVVLAPDDVSRVTSLSRRQIQDLVADKAFPAPVRLSERRVGWYEHEIDEWLMARPRGTFAKRKPAPAPEAAQ